MSIEQRSFVFLGFPSVDSGNQLIGHLAVLFGGSPGVNIVTEKQARGLGKSVYVIRGIENEELLSVTQFKALLVINVTSNIVPGYSPIFDCHTSHICCK